MSRLNDARAFLSEASYTAIFRVAITFAATFTASALVLFAFIYWQTAGLETTRIDRFIETQAITLSHARPEEIMWAVHSRLAADLHRVSFMAVFDTAHNLIAGNLKGFPSGLPLDGVARPVDVVWEADGQMRSEQVRAVGKVLPDGRLLLVGRNVEELVNLRRVVVRALETGVIPALLLSLVGGAYLSLNRVRRARQVYRALERIMNGQLGDRLPTRINGDHFDRLAASVNRLLDELQHLIAEVKGVGDDIAHDLRAPLARIRTQLDRARRVGTTVEQLRAELDSGIRSLDQVFTVITALLRIGEIENRQRRSGFGPVSLTEIVREVAELYEPVAESRAIRFVVHTVDDPTVPGDRDLLVEALINLVDNALKYTPAEGTVSISVHDESTGPVICVSDTGVGIATSEREMIMQPYYRSARTYRQPGTGVGLSLVSAIMRLHGFTIAIKDANPGSIFEMWCPKEEFHKREHVTIASSKPVLRSSGANQEIRYAAR